MHRTLNGEEPMHRTLNGEEPVHRTQEASYPRGIIPKRLMSFTIKVLALLAEEAMPCTRCQPQIVGQRSRQGAPGGTRGCKKGITGYYCSVEKGT